MGFVTVLRTVLAYFLAREIKELEEGKASHHRHSERQQISHDNVHKQNHNGKSIQNHHKTEIGSESSGETQRVTDISDRFSNESDERRRRKGVRRRIKTISILK
jgi:ABC-type nickel/cobalt efflux system permease component RcnA